MRSKGKRPDRAGILLTTNEDLRQAFISTIPFPELYPFCKKHKVNYGRSVNWYKYDLASYTGMDYIRPCEVMQLLRAIGYDLKVIIVPGRPAPE